MSREIKFRAWDEEAEQMFYSQETESDYFFEFMDGKLRGFAVRPPRPSSDPMEPPEPYCNDYPVMQFAGLHDKNGKEIFEGDIVYEAFVEKFGYYNIPEDCQGREYQRDEFAGVVLWDKAGAGFGIDTKGDGEIEVGINGEADELEILGNIHENPELIK